MKRAPVALGILVVIAVVATYLSITSLPPQQSEIEQRSDVVIINMTTRSWRFDPQIVSGNDVASATSSPSGGAYADTTIKVKLVSRVIIRITNLEPNQPHGFGLPDFGIQSVVNPPQQTVEVEFVANKEGTFTFFCTVFCGTGHPRHKGTLIVES